MYRSGGLAAVVLAFASIYYAATGLWKLYRYRRFRELFCSIFLLLVSAILIYILLTVGWDQPTGDQRVWFAAPAIILLLIWVLSGFFVRQYVENLLSSKEYFGPRKCSTKTLILRGTGWGMLLIAIGIWSYGAVRPLGNKFYIWGMLLCLVCFLVCAI